jgi:hypothetical protein
MNGRGTISYNRRSSTACNSPGRALQSYVLLSMLLLTVELCKGGEHAYKLL